MFRQVSDKNDDLPIELHAIRTLARSGKSKARSLKRNNSLQDGNRSSNFIGKDCKDTLDMLNVRYNFMVVIPVSTAVEDYFPHLNVDNFLRKVASGEINIPVIRVEPNSQKGARGVHLIDLACYLDARWAAAVKEAHQISALNT